MYISAAEYIVITVVILLLISAIYLKLALKSYNINPFLSKLHLLQNNSENEEDRQLSSNGQLQLFLVMFTGITFLLILVIVFSSLITNFSMAIFFFLISSTLILINLFYLKKSPLIISIIGNIRTSRTDVKSSIPVKPLEKPSLSATLSVTPLSESATPKDSLNKAAIQSTDLSKKSGPVIPQPKTEIKKKAAPSKKNTGKKRK